jgi:aryl sulfotransferase
MHYDDLSTKLSGQMQVLADHLSIGVQDERRPALEAATCTQMRRRAERLVPRVVPCKSSAAFFRAGRSGSGLAAVHPDDRTHFTARVAGLAEPDLLRWLLC